MKITAKNSRDSLDYDQLQQLKEFKGETLDLTGSKLSVFQLSQIFAALKTNPNIKHLILRKVEFFDENLAAVKFRELRATATTIKFELDPLEITTATATTPTATIQTTQSDPGPSIKPKETKANIQFFTSVPLTRTKSEGAIVVDDKKVAALAPTKWPISEPSPKSSLLARNLWTHKQRLSPTNNSSPGPERVEPTSP